MLYVYIKRDEDQRMTTAGREKNKPAHTGGGGLVRYFVLINSLKKKQKIKAKCRIFKICFTYMSCLGFLKIFLNNNIGEPAEQEKGHQHETKQKKHN